MSSPSESKMKLYHTRNIGLAAYLWFQGFRPVKKLWEDGKCRWWFETTPELSTEITAYQEDTAAVNPRAFYPKVTEFKRMVYQDRPS